MSIPEEISHIPGLTPVEGQIGRVTTDDPVALFVQYPKIFNYFSCADQDLCLDIYPRLVLAVCSDLNYSWLLKIIRRDGKLIKYVKDPDNRLKTAAVEQNGRAIKYIKDPNIELQLKAVRQNGAAIEFIPNPCLNVQLAAVRQDGWAISEIKNPAVAVQLAALRENRYVIKGIKEPCLQVQLEAVRQFGYTIKYIQEPDIRVQLEALRQSPVNIQWTPDLLKTEDPEIKREVDRILLGVNKKEQVHKVAELLVNLIDP